MPGSPGLATAVDKILDNLDECVLHYKRFSKALYLGEQHGYLGKLTEECMSGVGLATATCATGRG